MRESKEKFLLVDFRTMGYIANWSPVMAEIRAAGNPGKGRKIKPRPFSLVARQGRGRGTTYVVVGAFSRLGNAARRLAKLPKESAALICLAPGFSLVPARAQAAA